MILNIYLIIFFTIIIHAVETLSYSIRLGGFRLGKIVVAMSLTGVVLLVSRTSNMIQAPMLGSIIDQAKTDTSIHVVAIFRVILLSASIGTLLALLLYPTFTKLAMLIIKRFEAEGSIIGLINATNIQKLKRTKIYVKPPKFHMIHKLRVGGIPKRIMLINMAVTGIYTSGVLSALYAGILNPENSTAANMASGLINGVATILMTLLLDPKIALLTEKAIHDKRGSEKMAKTYGWLIISRFFGTLLAQVFFIPAAYWISWLCGLLS